ncbi:uncharacterized protein Z520_01520 [Fonsecaea multimorphosa CBS 102226]|uniref:AMP-activated protein kinase glycogen-binding domain-containing protein n=1 Tax=Fonsecaea multimorphosa CBS 102226 TaxID=1442371 RepID=A0A0D2L1W4_9EURO|nr:uncharacterized protein Z520_01520 [Fonsecaea multimorphosa CBS 102226]KIY03054.1 hypothetical protein Z520_01520 [Fonsecaea multimorphosa CBS 102226]OAL30549.1 hypothetical protein AYO22_01501 [Fonsecaea multimorphosa]
MGSFIFKWPHPEANDVHVTGTFDDWGKSVKLDKVGDIWEKEVDLPTDKKIYYKFVVNDQWIIDPEAPQEDDGRGNVNNVLLPENIKPKASMVPEAVTTSSAAPESTTAGLAGQVPLEPKREATEVTPASDSHLNKETTGSSVPGTFPETPGKEPDSFGVNPLPPTSGAGNPVDLPAGEKVPPSSEVTTNTTHSAVTTSKEGYENAGSGIPIIGGALAALGFGATAAKKENLIPESSLPMGEGAGKSLDAGPFISSAGASSTTAELAGKVPLEESKPATEVDHAQTITSTVPEVVKESIAEAHTDPEATASAEAVKEKAAVEEELVKKVPEAEEAGEPAPTIAAATTETAPSATPAPSGGPVPGTSSTAAAAVADGADGTVEPTEAPTHKVEVEKTEGDTTEYAPPHAAGAAPGVSESAAAAISDGAEDPTLADEPAVQMMNKNDAEAAGGPTAAATAATETPKATAPTTAAPESKKETKAAAPTSATSTPTKKPETTPTSTPSSSATKDKKKKHRVSSFFKKIFD